MNAWKSIILVGAALAIAAPTAGATLDRSTPAKAPHAKVVKHVKVTKAAKKTVTRVVRTQPLYIYVAGPATLSPAATSSDDCLQSGNNCSAQQLCDIWGMNCDQVTPVHAYGDWVENLTPSG